MFNDLSDFFPPHHVCRHHQCPQLEYVSIFFFADTNSFFLVFAEDHRHTRKAWLWDTDAGGRLQAVAGLQQETAGPRRLQEPADL